MRVLLSDTNWTTSTIAHDLKQAGLYVTLAHTGEDLMEHAKAGEQDIILLDMDMPDMSVYEVMRGLSFLAAAPVTVMTPAGDVDARLKAFAAGADDCVESNVPGAELYARLVAVARRYAGFAAAELSLGSLSVNVFERRASVHGQPMHLSRLEYELVEMLVLRRGRLASRDQIMAQLYAWEDEPDARIIDVYICRIRAKIAELGGEPEMISTSVGRGYRFGDMLPKMLAA